MMKFEKKQVRVISVAIALVFVFSVVGLAVSQSGLNGVASAAGSASSVGVINQQQVVGQHPDMATAKATMQKEIETAKADFDEKAKSMNDKEKQEYYQQLQQRLANKEKELIQPIFDKVDAAIKSVAEAKGLSVVMDKSNVVYGGQDITNDVIKKLAK